MTRTMKLAALVLTLGGCAESVEPVIPVDDYELPPPDLSLDPARLRPGTIILTGCLGDRRLESFRGVYEWILVDIFLAAGDGSGAPAADVERLEALGARILYRHHAPAVRARVLQADIPNIVQSQGFGVYLRDVPDDTRYDVPDVSAGFRTFSLDRQETLYGDLGGLVTRRSETFEYLSGVLPDRSIATLRDHPDVEGVSISGLGCLAG